MPFGDWRSLIARADCVVQSKEKNVTTGVSASVKRKDLGWVQQHMGQLQSGDFVLMATPQMGDDLIVHKQMDADGDCFNPINIGRVVSEPASRDNVGYDIELAMFTTDSSEIDGTKTVNMHLRRAEGTFTHQRN